MPSKTIFDVIADAHPENPGIRSIGRALMGEVDAPKAPQEVIETKHDGVPTSPSNGVVTKAIGKGKAKFLDGMTRSREVQATNHGLYQAASKAPMLLKLGGQYIEHYSKARAFISDKIATGDIGSQAGDNLFAAALAIRGSAYGGKTWSEIYVNPSQDSSVYKSNTAPALAANLFIADSINRQLQALELDSKAQDYTPAEIHSALMALRQSSFEDIPVLRSYKDKKGRMLMSVTGMTRAINKIALHWARLISDDYYTIADMVA